MLLLINIAGTGKSYTIEGLDSGDNRGIIPRASEEVFSCILYIIVIILAAKRRQKGMVIILHVYLFVKNWENYVMC